MSKKTANRSYRYQSKLWKVGERICVPIPRTIAAAIHQDGLRDHEFTVEITDSGVAREDTNSPSEKSAEE